MPYNEFGEYIPDDLALDEMKYELAKKGIMPLRPGGSDVPYVASEVPQTYIAKPPPKPASTATNVPQAIADRLGLSAIPQAALGMISSFPAAVAKETGFPKVAEAIQYTPTSKMGQEVLEGASRLPQVVTGSEMGFGPLAEFYVPRRAFGLERRPFLSPDDVRVMGSRAIETGRELRNVPEDFSAAKEGLRRESVFGGPTLGARTQGLFDEIGDVMARREMQGLSPIPGIPDVVSPQTRMYAVRPANVGQMIDPTDLPTAKYGDTPRKVRTVQNIIQDIVPYTESDYPHNTSSEYYNAAVRDAPKPLENAWRTFSQKKINEMFPDAPDDSAAAEAYGNRFNQKEFALSQINMLSDFARSPEALSAIESVANERDQLINEYNAQKNKPRKDLKTDEERRAHEENVEQLELQLLQKDLMPELSREEFIERITPPTKEEYMRRAQAAKDYLEGTFKKDIAKYIGTSQGPQMELAKRGITMAPKEELLDMMKKFESPRGAFRGELDDLGKERAKAGFNPRGEMYPLIVQKETEVKDLQTQLNDLNRQKNELRDLHRIEMPDEPDPAKNPTETGAKYRALTNPMNTLIDKIEQNKKQLENFRLANAYETISDVAYSPTLAKEFKRTIPFAEKQFFPNLEKTPDTAQMFNVKPRELGELGIPFLAEMIVKNIMSGRIPLNEKGKPMTSIDKIIEQLTKPRIKEETIKEAESRKGMVQLNDFAQETLSKIPPDLRFKNSSVLELTKDSTEDAVRRQISFDCMVLNHCIGATEAPHPGINPFTGERQDHSYPVDPATGKDRGDRKFSSGYMTAVLKGTQRSAHLRDNATGLPVVTINMKKEGSDKYNLDYVSGYGNKATPEDIAAYAADVKDYLNLRANIIKGPGDSLSKWGILDGASVNGRSKMASLLNLNPDAIPSLGLPRFVLENDVRKMALEQPMGDTHADMVRRRAQLNDEYDRIVRTRGEDDPEAQDLGSQIADLTQRLQRASRQVATQGSPNLFRRMTSEALTNELYRDNTRGQVLAIVDNLLTDDSYGLREFWEDDYDFSPTSLQRFINAVRNGDNLPRTLTDVQDLTGFAPQMRERLTRFQMDTDNFTPQQRELLVRALDDFAETNINQLADNLEPDIQEEGIRLFEEAHPGTFDFLEEIARRRRGEDFTPEAAPAQTAMPTPRDIANQVVSTNRVLRDEIIQQVTERLNNSVRNLPEDRETLQEALAQYQANPLDIPGALEMVLPPEDANTNRRIISNYLIQQIQNRLNNLAPADPNIRERSVNFLANDIVVPNAAFRNQTVENVASGIRDQLLPSVERFNSNIPGDRDYLENQLGAYQNSPLDQDLGQTLEDYIRANPQQENRIRESVADFMIQQISGRLNNQLMPEHVRGVITRELNELMALGQLDLAGSVLNRIFEGEGAFNGLTDEQRAASSDYLNSLLRQLINDPDYRPAGAAAPQFDQTITSYRDQYTNEEMGSRRAFDQIMQAERMTPGAINEAIRRTDGRAMYDEEVMRFYNVQAPAGISQINNALRRYMEGNGFDHPPRPAATQQEALGDILDDALETAGYNYPENIVDVMQRDLDRLMTEGVRFDTSPDEFILRLTQLSAEAGTTGLEGDAIYATAMNELASSLLYSYQQLPDTPGNAARQLPAPAANPIDELERRYGEAPRAPIDIVTDGLNRPITQFERDYSEEVQNEYREILREIDPAVNTLNLQNAMHHLGIIHDMLLSGDHEPGYFNLSSTAEMNRFADLIDRHFEVFRQLENLLDNADREPPEGRKRGGFIERATGVRSYSDLKRDKFNRNFYDDGQAALDFQLRHGVRSDQLGVSPKRYPERSEADIIAPKSDEHLSFRHQELQDDLKRGGRVRRMSNGGVNKVRPTPNIPATPAKQNPNKTDYVPNVPADPGFKETLERVTNKPLHPSVARGVAEGRIPLSDAQRLSDYANTPGSPKVGSGSSSMPDQSQKMENYLNRVKVGEVQNPYPAEQRQPISRDLTGRSDFTREQLREQALRDSTLNPRSGGVSGGGGNLTDVELKNRLGSRNPTYNAGGKVSIDQMRYELLRK
jgi:hypothetical protein